MSNIIKIIDLIPMSVAKNPQPSIKDIPDWYIDTQEYFLKGNEPTIKIENGIKSIDSTIKKCVPVYDAMTAGYIIYSFTDIYISQIDEKPHYQWHNLVDNVDIGINWYVTEQADNHPDFQNIPYPRWILPWAISTPNGYSCIIIPPMHRESKIFEILPAIIDTDKSITQINLPFVLKDIKFEGTIPAGTPIAQIIPFKRESWKLEKGNEKDIEKNKNTIKLLQSSFVNVYKNKFWQKKSYK
jgi:hypothetical protein